jgi:hypothetical protein
MLLCVASGPSITRIGDYDAPAGPPGGGNRQSGSPGMTTLLPYISIAHRCAIDAAKSLFRAAS